MKLAIQAHPTGQTPEQHGRRTRRRYQRNPREETRTPNLVPTDITSTQGATQNPREDIRTPNLAPTMSNLHPRSITENPGTNKSRSTTLLPSNAVAEPGAKHTPQEFPKRKKHRTPTWCRTYHTNTPERVTKPRTPNLAPSNQWQHATRKKHPKRIPKRIPNFLQPPTTRHHHGRPYRRPIEPME